MHPLDNLYADNDQIYHIAKIKWNFDEYWERDLGQNYLIFTFVHEFWMNW